MLTLGYCYRSLFQHVSPYFRIIIGAPKGTYPGGLNLTDYSLPAVNETGLVYNCQFGSGVCEGVTGNTALYVTDPNAIDGRQSLTLNDIVITFGYNPANSEGRLFDQAREYSYVSSSPHEFLSA